MKKLLVFMTLSLFLVNIITAQTYLSVDLDHPVYILLDNAEQRQILPALPTAKPYSRAQILDSLYKIENRSDMLSDIERETLNRFINELETEYTGLKYGNMATEGEMGSFEAGFKFEGNTRLNFNNIENYHSYNGILAYFEGDISNFLSYYAAAGGSVDNISPDYFYKHLTMEANMGSSPYYIMDGAVKAFTGEEGNFTPPGTFSPYSFTAQWDGHHSNPITNGLNDGVTNYFMVGLRTEDEIAAQFYNDKLKLRWGKIRRDWGYGDGSLYLSGTAYPFEGFEVHANPVSWFNYSYTAGSLGNWFVDSYLDMDIVEAGNWEEEGIMLSPFSEQKMFSLQQFEVKPTEWLSLLVASSAIWAKRFELAYLSPLMLPFMTQEQNGDTDNVAIIGGASVRIPHLGKVYFTGFLDETAGTALSEIFTYPRNMYAYQGGLQSPIPWLSFANLTLQYTKINPFVYSHYFEDDMATTSVPVSMTYTHAGENLGYFLPPNADEILVKMEFFPIPDMKAHVKYQLIRHGTNDTTDSDEDGDGIPDGQIYGDIYIPYDYSQSYPDKDFLKDGVYDWSNIVSVGGEFQFPNYPVSLGLEYIFCYTFWDVNGRDVTTPDSIFQNIISFSFSISH
ncbi:MAG: hypothetical protein JEY99_09280 [Spirochaetales bacterium]|nr:hypothetical protein [Spirochaetales bacterium]